MFLYTGVYIKMIASNIPLCDKAMHPGKVILLTQQLTKEINDNEEPTTLIVDPFWNNRGFTLVDILHQDEKKINIDIENTSMELITTNKNLLNKTKEYTHEPTFTKHFIGPYTFLHNNTFFCLNRGVDVPIKPCKGVFLRLFFIPYISKKFRNGNYFAICVGDTCLKRKKFTIHKERQYRVSYEEVNNYKQLDDERFLFQFFEPENFMNKIRNINAPAHSGFKGCAEGSDSIFNRIRETEEEEVDENLMSEAPAHLPRVPEESMYETPAHLPRVPEESTHNMEPQLENIVKNIEALSNKFERLNEQISSKQSFEPKLIDKLNEAIQKLKSLNSNDSEILKKIDNLSKNLQSVQNSGNTSLEKLDEIICAISNLNGEGEKVIDNMKSLQDSSSQVPKQILQLTNFINNIDSNIKSVVRNTSTTNNDMRTYKTLLEGVSLKQEECNSACERGIMAYMKNKDLCGTNCVKVNENRKGEEQVKLQIKDCIQPETKCIRINQPNLNKPCEPEIKRETIIVTKTINKVEPIKSIYRPCESNETEAVKRTVSYSDTNIPKMYLHTTSSGPSLSDWRNAGRIFSF